MPLKVIESNYLICFVYFTLTEEYQIMAHFLSDHITEKDAKNAFDGKINKNKKLHVT